MDRVVLPKEYTQLVVSLVIVSIITSIVLAYKLVRPYFSCKVSCWFCHKQSSVPYGNRNCWDCLNCEQYNGFTDDGDYNKAIPSQYDEDLNHTISCTEKSDHQSVSRLCERCDKNQMLKIKQLANFSPTHEDRFDAEVEAYKRKLERVYRLCNVCEVRVNDVITRQNLLLRPKVLKYIQSASRTNHSAASALQEDNMHKTDRLATTVHRTLSVSSPILSLVILLVYATSLSPRLLEIPQLYTAHGYLTAIFAQLKLTGLTMQLMAILTGLKLGRGGIWMSFIISVLWLYSYGHEVLLSHSLLPRVLSGIHVPILLHILVITFSIVKNDKPQRNRALKRPVSPSTSDIFHQSMLSNHSDSGVSGSHMNDDIYTPYPSPPPYPTYDQPDMSGRGGATAGGGGAEQMDCSSLPADISGLHLGQRVNSFSNLNCNNSVRESPRARPLIRPSQLDTFSVHSRPSLHPQSSPESVYSFRTAAPSIRAGPQYTQQSNPPFSAYSQATARSGYAPSIGTARTGYTPSHAPSGFSYAPAVSPPPPQYVGGYDNIPSVSPQGMSPSSTYYSPSTVLSYQSRMPPERVSLLTQIFLGISLGVNVSIAAFIMGRYSVNGDLLSFV